MKGMTIDEYAEVVKFAQEHHKFALWLSDEQREKRQKEFPKLNDSFGFGIKYIDSVYDSRDGKIWLVKFRQGVDGFRFSCNHWTDLNPPPKHWKYDNLYDLCMAYLKGEFKPKDEFYFDDRDEHT